MLTLHRLLTKLGHYEFKSRIIHIPCHLVSFILIDTYTEKSYNVGKLTNSLGICRVEEFNGFTS